MLATAVVVFREVLEAALILSIVLAATRGVPARGAWIAGGVVGGVTGAVIVAIFAEGIAAAASGMGQEIFNAAVLFIAVLMLGWHNIWMKQHGREMAVHLKAVGEAIRSGAKSLTVLAIVVGMAVLREGSEVVLFLYGIAASGKDTTASMAGGGAFGLVLGAGVGALLYFGLLRIPSRYLFTVTSWLILLLAAGMAAQAASFLVQADILPPLGEMLWDSSWLVDDGSLAGRILHALVGYTARPSGIQLTFYVATAAVIAGMMKLADRANRRIAHSGSALSAR
jgi:high-affinity iron transporter